MRTKQNGQAVFTRTVEAIEPEMLAFRSPCPVAHVWARGSILSSSEATECLISGIHSELGNSVVPVFHRIRRSK